MNNEKITEETNRRSFIKYSTLGIFGLFFAAGYSLNSQLQIPHAYLRPPGALNESDFLALCIKCGQCVKSCPYDTLNLLDMNYGHSIGTPYFDALNRGCYLCEDFPCIEACPTDALTKETKTAHEVEIGIAVFKYANKCIGISTEEVRKKDIQKVYAHSKNKEELAILKQLETYVGKACSICADMCPYPDSNLAIEMIEDKSNNGKKPQINSKCVGCGVCAELCPTQAIIIEPRLSYEDYYIKGLRNNSI